jgi:hypothetical protein
LAIEKALEAKMSELDLDKICQSLLRKRFKNFGTRFALMLNCARELFMLAKSQLTGESHTKLLMDAKVRFASLAVIQTRRVMN